MTVRYEIRDEAVWADGVPISGAGFQFTYDTIVSVELEGVAFESKTIYQEIVATDVGPKTFTMTLPKPTIIHQDLFRVLIPEHDVAGTDILTDWNDRAWVPGGPFVPAEWERGRQITLTRNPNYWKVDAETGQQLPYLDRVVFRFIPENDALVAAFRAREVDVIRPPPWIEQTARLLDLESDGASVTTRPGPVWEHLNFQFGPGRLDRNTDSMNEHLAYRQAIAHAIDHDLIADDITGGLIGPLDSYLDAFTPAVWGGAWLQYPCDPERARELLTQLCVDLERDCTEDPVVTVLSTTSNGDGRPRVALMLADMLAKVGIAYEAQLEDSQLFFGETLDDGRWDLGEWAWVDSSGLSGLVSIHDVWDPEAPPPDGSNFYRWGTPDSAVIDDNTARFAEVRDEMNATVDEEELVALIREAEQILADQVAIIPLWARPTIVAIWADEIGGYVFNPCDAGHTWNIETWYRVDN